MQQNDLELKLLVYWKENNVRWLYKYKNHVNEFYAPDIKAEIFYDITEGRMFKDIVDIANYPQEDGITGDDVKISIDDLIRSRLDIQSLQKGEDIAEILSNSGLLNHDFPDSKKVDLVLRIKNFQSSKGELEDLISEIPSSVLYETIGHLLSN